jgi:inorganic pyrophosphatase
MPNLVRLPIKAEDGYLRVVIETPRGSHAKLAYDPKLGVFTLSKSLLTGLTYAYDWGFIPSTKADDGDPLDIMVIHDAGTYPGLVLSCRLIGILQINQKKSGSTVRNDRLFAVPRNSHEEKGLKDVRGCSDRGSAKVYLAGRSGGALDRSSWWTGLLRLLDQLSDRCRQRDYRGC